MPVGQLDFFGIKRGRKTGQHLLKIQHPIGLHALVASLKRRQEVKTGVCLEVFFNGAGRKALVCHDDSFFDVILGNKRVIRHRINAVAGKNLRTDRFIFLKVIGVEQ